MGVIPKKIIRDKESKPVAVQIAWEDWQEIERRLRAEAPEWQIVDISPFRGALKTDIDPLEYQRSMRDEWP